MIICVLFFFSEKDSQTQDQVVEIIQQLIWLLPVANRDTLECLLNCLRMVADHSQNSKDEFENEVNLKFSATVQLRFKIFSKTFKN